jgi:hypothetical protein
MVCPLPHVTTVSICRTLSTLKRVFDPAASVMLPRPPPLDVPLDISNSGDYGADWEVRVPDGAFTQDIDVSPSFLLDPLNSRNVTQPLRVVKRTGHGEADQQLWNKANSFSCGPLCPLEGEARTNLSGSEHPCNS